MPELATLMTGCVPETMTTRSVNGSSTVCDPVAPFGCGAAYAVEHTIASTTHTIIASTRTCLFANRRIFF